jgi:hypothetical protein
MHEHADRATAAVALAHLLDHPYRLQARLKHVLLRRHRTGDEQPERRRQLH